MSAPISPNNPLNPSEQLRPASSLETSEEVPNPGSVPHEEDSAVTKAEKYERSSNQRQDDGPPPSKRVRLDEGDTKTNGLTPSERQKGVAPIKKEYLIDPPSRSKNDRSSAIAEHGDSNALDHSASRDQPSVREKRKEKSKGQNSSRRFGSSKDERGLCQSRSTFPEFSPRQCPFGDSCKFEHDLRKYLKDWKREDLSTFGGKCPIWELKGKCDMGWKCRFVGSHMEERTAEDGRTELILLEDDRQNGQAIGLNDESIETKFVNVVSTQAKTDLMKRRYKTPKADAYSDWLEQSAKRPEEQVVQKSRKSEHDEVNTNEDDNSNADAKEKATVEDNRAEYTEPPFLPSEKRRIYFGAETPVLAPLTTQGNLPFRRLCVDLGVQLTYSEMAMSLPLIQGQKSEWALMKAHESEITPPRYNANSPVTVYDNSKDFKFGAQIAASKPYQAIKATEILSQLCPHLRVIDLNCGCPIDLVYRQGAGSALLDSQSKLEKILRGMGAVSGDIPITVKIRSGTKDGKPTALKLLNRLIYGDYLSNQVHGGPSGVAAISLHGRSRQQRYTKNADWEYISDCAALIKRLNERGNDLADTIREVDARHRPAGDKVYFIGNGDCYSHTDYYNHLELAKVDSVMLGRGALIKPWVFEEIEKGQYIDKSATERLGLIEKFVRFGLEVWGSDEVGVGTTRRFLLEWLSFAYRYVPVGILEHLPPSLQDRPPAWRGRNELETLLGSDNFRDWIKISEMFLGPAHKDFRFEPKHKSNSYEIEAEG